MNFKPNTKTEQLLRMYDFETKEFTNSEGLIKTQKEAANGLARLEKILYKIRNIKYNKQKSLDLNGPIKRICEILIELDGYHQVWICLVDEEGKQLEMNHAGSGLDSFQRIKIVEEEETFP